MPKPPPPPSSLPPSLGVQKAFFLSPVPEPPNTQRHAQAACIGAKDADSPMRAIFVVTLFNVFLDWLFIGPFGWGVEGAAWATIIAQTAGAIYLYFAVGQR